MLAYTLIGHADGLVQRLASAIAILCYTPKPVASHLIMGGVIFLRF